MRSGQAWVVAVALGAAACGGSGGGGGGGSNSCSPGPSASMSITASGLSPVNVCVQPGGTVTFSNTDQAVHDIEFDSTGCPTVGDIAAGAQMAVTFPTQGNCTFHDGRNASNAAFQGTVAVTAVQVSGGGY